MTPGRSSSELMTVRIGHAAGAPCFPTVRPVLPFVAAAAASWHSFDRARSGPTPPIARTGSSGGSADTRAFSLGVSAASLTVMGPW
jgi:hypothetical protein